MDHVNRVNREQNTVYVSIEPDVTQSIKILHIEDDETVAAIAKEIFEEQGWQVHTCDNGNAALEHISGGAHYDFLLFDYDLPGVNGLELVQHVRKLPHRFRTLVGVLSATPIEADAREAGADVFLCKPQDIRSLAETISKLLANAVNEI